MDERIITVLKALSYGDLCADDIEGSCLYCSCDSYEKIQNPVHDIDCPVTLARQLLKEQGMPILLYMVEFEYPSYLGNWQKSTYYRLGFNEEEVRNRFPENKEPHLYPKRRNVQVSVIGEAQEVLKKE